MQNEYEIKKEMCEIGRRVYNRGMVAANDGNFSVKLNDHEFLCTPTGVSKGFMTPEYICKVEFCICKLPWKIIRKSLLATSSYQKIRVRNILCVKISIYHSLIYSLWCNLSLFNILCNLLDGSYNLISATIIDCYCEIESCIILSLFFKIINTLNYIIT